MARAGEYRFIAQERVIFGRPAAKSVRDEAERRGAGRVFLVASKTLSRETDVVDRIKTALGDSAVGLFDETVAHVPRETVLALAERVRAASPDLIVTIGGGHAHRHRQGHAGGACRKHRDRPGLRRLPHQGLR